MQSKRNTMIAVVTGALFIMAMFSIAQAQEKKIDIKDLPAAVIAAFQKTYPKATITGATTEVEDGKTMYEVESKDGTVNRDLLYTAKGEVFEIEEGIAPESLPDNVKATLEKQFTKYEVKKAEKVTKGTKVEYELVIKSDKRKFAVVLDSSARIVKSDAVKVTKEKKEKKEKDEKDEK